MWGLRVSPGCQRNARARNVDLITKIDATLTSRKIPAKLNHKVENKSRK